MKTIKGTYNGTGAAVYLCIGAVPEKFILRAVEDSDLAHLEWSDNMRGAEIVEGVRYVGSSGALQVAAMTAGNGLTIYEGGDLMTSSIQTTVTYGEGVYLWWDNVDYRQDTTNAVASLIDTWTLGSSANRTGSTNANLLATTRIGEGSRILIEEDITHIQKWATVEAWAASQGATANQITLSRAINSGKVLRITGMYSLIPIPLGRVAPPGIKVNATTVVNVNDEIQAFEASWFDN